MSKAFVAKLAKEGARDPEALAAWIGRKKHGAGAFKKLAAAGRGKGGAGSTSSPGRGGGRGESSAPQRAEPRDMKRGFQSSTGHLEVTDSELETLRDQAAFNRGQLAMLDAAGARDSAAEVRTKLAEQEKKIADAEYARETVAGRREYDEAVQEERKAVNEAVSKARKSNDPDDWAAAASAAEGFAQRAGKSPYGSNDAGWYTSEAKSARESAEMARERRQRTEVLKREQTLPPPKPGERPVAHASHLDSDGMQSFGDPETGRRSIARSPGVTAMPDTGAEGHGTALQKVSPAFRRKVMEARASGRPWLHHIRKDGIGAEVHELQYVDANGKLQKAQFLERNSKAWKSMPAAQQWAGR